MLSAMPRLKYKPMYALDQKVDEKLTVVDRTVLRICRCFPLSEVSRLVRWHSLQAKRAGERLSHCRRNKEMGVCITTEKGFEPDAMS